MIILDNFLLIIVAFGVFSLIIAFLWDLRHPPVAVDAVVITKRSEVKSKDSNRKVYTVYYQTFQPVGCNRKEYEVPAASFAVTAVGDRGKLTCRGGRFIAFKAD